MELYGGCRFFFKFSKWEGGPINDTVELLKLFNLKIGWGFKFIFRAECNAKKFILPGFHQQQVNLKYKYVCIHLSF